MPYYDTVRVSVLVPPLRGLEVVWGHQTLVWYGGMDSEIYLPENKCNFVRASLCHLFWTFARREGLREVPWLCRRDVVAE